MLQWIIPNPASVFNMPIQRSLCNANTQAGVPRLSFKPFHWLNKRYREDKLTSEFFEKLPTQYVIPLLKPPLEKYHVGV